MSCADFVPFAGSKFMKVIVVQCERQVARGMLDVTLDKNLDEFSAKLHKFCEGQAP